jgi:hypothetical protein
MEAVRQAGDRNMSINGKAITEVDVENGYGYGVTDFLRAYNILKYGEKDVFMLSNDGYSSHDRTFHAFTEANVFPESVTATPITFVNGQIVEGKTIKLKYKTILTSNKYFSHELILPKLSKNQPYQFYRLDFVINGNTQSRIVGLEPPMEEPKR